MSVAKEITAVVNQLPEGKPFTARAFCQLGTNENVRKALTRMTNAGEIRRIARGIFVKPKKLRYMSAMLPTTEEIAKVIAESTGELIAIHGAEAAHRLHLSTQVPMQTIFYTTGNTRQIKLENKIILLKHISPRKLVAPGTIAGLVISALWYLGRNAVNIKTIRKINKLLPESEYQTVLQAIGHMPAWMANLFHQHEQGKVRNGRQFFSTI